MRYFLLIGFLLTIGASHLVAQRHQLAGYTPDNYEAECAGVAQYGAKMLRIWGYGRQPDLAILQAKRNAVHAMLFKGVLAGECRINPLVKDPALMEQHQAYFDAFFEDGGAYLSYVALSGDAPEGVVKVKDRGRNVYKASLLVIVQYDALRTRLEKDINLPSLTDRF